MGSKVVVLTVMALILSECWTLPLNEKEKRESVNGHHHNSDGDKTSKDKAGPEPDDSELTLGCFKYKQEVWVVTVYELDKDRQYVARNQTLTRTVRECCDGYIGQECNEKLDITEPIICGNLTCEADPFAYCAIVKKCGRDIPVFLGEDGIPSQKCNQTVDIGSLSCTGVCKEDPCLNAHCSGHPNAICFPIGCECKAVWLTHDPVTNENVEVNCGSEDSESVRRKRDSSCPS